VVLVGSEGDWVFLIRLLRVMWMKLPHPRYLLRLVPPSLIEISNFLQRKVVRPWLLMELVPLVNDLLWIALHLVFLSIRLL